jgi:hypothetical protein
MAGGGIDQLDTVTNSTEPSSARRQIEALLRSQNKPLNSENVSRVLFANQSDPSVLPGLVGAPEPVTPTRGNRGGDGGSRSAPPSVGRSAPSGGNVAADIEGRSLPLPPIPPAHGGEPFVDETTPMGVGGATPSGASAASGASGGPMVDPSLLPYILGGGGAALGAGGIGAIIMRALANGGASQAMGPGPEMPPTGRVFDANVSSAPPTPSLAGPRASLPPPSAPGAAPTGVPSAGALPSPDPMQSALSRAVPPEPMTPPGVGGPQSAGALPPPGPRPPIALPDQGSGPTIPLSDATPLPPSSAVPPGPTSPTNVGRTASPAADPRAIARPMMDPSRTRMLLDMIAKNAGRMSPALRAVR